MLTIFMELLKYCKFNKNLTRNVFATLIGNKIVLVSQIFKKINVFIIILTTFVLTLMPNRNCYALEHENYQEVWHNELFEELADRIYCISDTTGSIYEYNAAIDECCDIILKNIEEGCDPNEKGYYGNTPLISASALGYPKLVEALLNIPEIRKNIDLRNNF